MPTTHVCAGMWSVSNVWNAIKPFPSCVHYSLACTSLPCNNTSFIDISVAYFMLLNVFILIFPTRQLFCVCVGQIVFGCFVYVRHIIFPKHMCVLTSAFIRWTNTTKLVATKVNHTAHPVKIRMTTRRPERALLLSTLENTKSMTLSKFTKMARNFGLDLELDLWPWEGHRT